MAIQLFSLTVDFLDKYLLLAENKEKLLMTYWSNKEKLHFNTIEINKLLSLLFLGVFLEEKNFSKFLSSFSTNLLALYHECHCLIGYTTHFLFCDR